MFWACAQYQLQHIPLYCCYCGSCSCGTVCRFWDTCAVYWYDALWFCVVHVYCCTPTYASRLHDPFHAHPLSKHTRPVNSMYEACWTGQTLPRPPFNTSRAAGHVPACTSGIALLPPVPSSPPATLQHRWLGGWICPIARLPGLGGCIGWCPVVRGTYQCRRRGSRQSNRGHRFLGPQGRWEQIPGCLKTSRRPLQTSKPLPQQQRHVCGGVTARHDDYAETNGDGSHLCIIGPTKHAAVQFVPISTAARVA